MFKSKIFLTCAVPNAMAILLAPKYQIIYINPLYGEERKNSLNFLFTKFNQIMVHPIKLSNKLSQKKVIQYISFVNANEF